MRVVTTGMSPCLVFCWARKPVITGVMSPVRGSCRRVVQRDSSPLQHVRVSRALTPVLIDALGSFLPLLPMQADLAWPPLEGVPAERTSRSGDLGVRGSMSMSR